MNQEQLNAISHEIRTQDNRATADPLFCVFEKERIYGLRPDYSDEYEWCDCDGEEVDISEYDGIDGVELEERGIHKIHYIERDRFVCAHFTEKSAKEHIRTNGHNLKKPFIYVTSLWRCPEMIAVREFLKKQGGC